MNNENRERTIADPVFLTELVDAFLIASVVDIGTQEYEDNCWAHELLSWYTYQDPQSLWKVIQEVCNRPLSESEAGSLAAGPLEELIFYHGADYIDQIELFAASNKTFIQLLNGVCSRGRDSSHVWQRIEGLLHNN